MKETRPHANRELSIERVFDAPRKLVWEAWTDGGHIAAWWGPPNMTTQVLVQDLRAGGEWKYIMVAPDGSEFPSFGTFSEVVEYERIVTTADFGKVTVGVTMTILFEEVEDGTKLTLIVTHPTEEYKKAQEDMGFQHGWGAHFDSLTAFLAEQG